MRLEIAVLDEIEQEIQKIEARVRTLYARRARVLAWKIQHYEQKGLADKAYVRLSGDATTLARVSRSLHEMYVRLLSE